MIDNISVNQHETTFSVMLICATNRDTGAAGWLDRYWTHVYWLVVSTYTSEMVDLHRYIYIYIDIWLVVYLPLWKILVSWVSWDDDIPSRWKVKFHSCSKAPASFSTNQLIEPPKTPSFFRSHVEPRLSPSLWYPKSFWNFWTGHVLC